MKGSTLRGLRMQYGLSQVAIARQMGITRQAVRNAELADRTLPETALRYATAVFALVRPTAIVKMQFDVFVDGERALSEITEVDDD